MEAIQERRAWLIENFPVALRLRVKSLAVAQGRPFAEVVAELLEKALAAEEAKAGGRRRGTDARKNA